MANIERQKMREQAADARKKNFSEVALGLSDIQVGREAERCLLCKKPLCVKGCPVGIDIPGFIRLIKEHKFIEAAAKIKETNVLPGVCGRVCPQETQCEKECILAKKGTAVAIGNLERFVADYAMDATVSAPLSVENNGKKVAIIGSGPSGLTCAGELRKRGYHVTVFEALHELGGVLVYGIPEFRLPKVIVQKEIEFLRSSGVGFKTNQVVGRTVTIDELLSEEGFNAVFVGTGAGYPSFMNIEGEDLNYVYSANEFLTRINLMRAYKFPKVDTPIWVGKRVAVIGGGNTAMDAARCALRLGPEKVYLLYRRSRDEMPARVEEIHHAEEEGIEFMFLTTPIRYEGDAKGRLKKAVCLKMKLGEPDASGRRRPVPIEGSEFELEIDSAVVAIGTQANPIIASTTQQLNTNKWGYIVADDQGRTTRKGVYAGGDIVTGAATVIEAMGAGRTTAQTIDEDIQKD